MMPINAQQDDFKFINFSKSEQLAKKYEGEDLYNLPQLAYKLTATLDSDVEKFRAIYLWVCFNIKGEYNLMSKSERYQLKHKNNPEALKKWNASFKKEIFQILLTKKTTLCTGYAYLIKELSSLAGIECEIITGYSILDTTKTKYKTIPNHAWNAVKLNDKWYLCDATWSSGYIDMATYIFDYDYVNTYFLQDPIQFNIHHIPLDDTWKLID